jgi:hypothetical protein
MLSRNERLGFGLGIGFLVGCLILVGFMLTGFGVPPGSEFALLVPAGTALVIGLWEVAKSYRNMARLVRHPGILELVRFGPPLELMADVDTELADTGRVKHLCGELSCWRGWDFKDVYLTPFWLVYRFGPVGSWGVGLQIFLLGSVVVGCRHGHHVVVIDRHGVRADIPGNDAGLTRLLAEILVRVPWALSRFDEESERTWHEDREQIIAAVDRRRQEIQ